MTLEQEQLLHTMARRYIWWKEPEQALKYPLQVAAQVMNIGDWEDVQRFAKAMGDDYLRSVLESAEIGQFDERSWSYWHYRLHLTEPGAVPPLPERKLG